MSKTRWGILVICVAVGAALVATLVVLRVGQGASSDTAQHTPAPTAPAASHKDTLQHEFQGAYPYHATPNGDVVELQLVASEGTHELFPGTTTNVWHYNGTVPGPEIRIQQNDTLKINFINNLPEPTSIHFHGIRVPNAMDGVPGVTQPLVQPGEGFVYTFTPKDVGTYWFHPHANSSEQLERGLYGVVVVEDAYSETYSHDVVWVIDDWLLQDDYQIYPNFVTRHDLAHDGRWGNVITTNGSTSHRLTARPGERLRVRLVNVSNGRVYRLNFNGLTATAVAVDGTTVRETLNAHGFDLAPGNRIDVDITIPDSAAGQRFIIEDTFTRQPHVLGTILVEGDVAPTPTFAYPINENLPRWAEGAALPVDFEYVFNIQEHPEKGLQWTLNANAYPRYTLHTYQSGSFYKIRFSNTTARIHPMHLHGQFFKVLTRDGVPVEEPFFRDTVLVYSNETVEIGMVPLDTGRWANHCHILEHADSGMMTIMKVL